MAAKTSDGNFFEDFELGQIIQHATPRTLTTGDAALYTALYGSRFAVQSSEAFATAIGYEQAPLDDLLVFHTVFGKTVPDISLNAVANLGYADCRFLKPVFPGDTLTATSKVIGLRENSNRKTGVVYVRSTGRNQHGGTVLDYARWVMVRKRDEAAATPEEKAPDLPAKVEAAALGNGVPHLTPAAYDWALAGSQARWPARRTSGTTTRRASGSTIWTARPSRKPNTRWPRACIRTRPGCISISTPRARGVSGGGWSMADM